MNFIDATVERGNGRPVAVASDGDTVAAARMKRRAGWPEVVYGVRPEHLDIARTAGPIPAKVVVVEPTGAETMLVVHSGRARRSRPCSASATVSSPASTSASSRSSIKFTCSSVPAGAA